MPEYSSTTITPSDGVQVPGMNGSTSGNFLLSALKSYILSEKGLANGLASLDGNGKLLSSQLPDLADDVIVVASYASLPATGTAGKIYITADNNKMYRWDPDLETPNYVELSIDLSEYARIVDIQDGNIQAGVAVKAFQDAMGRAIITTYETKADASDLKSAITANSQRIENLEVAVSGSLVQTNTDSTMANTKTITNANEILPWAILKRVGARSTQFNQLIHNTLAEIKAINTSGTWNDNVYTKDNLVFTFNATDLSITVTGTSGASDFDFNLGNSQTISGHKYLLIGSPTTADSTKWYLTWGLIGADYNGSGRISDGNGNSIFTKILVRANQTLSNDVFRPQLFDLTAMSMYDSGKSDAENISLLKIKYPSTYPYDAGHIYHLNPSGMKVVGWNKWNENWVVGAIDGTTGQDKPSDSGTEIRAVDYIPVDASQTYYSKTAGQVMWVYQYDSGENYISRFMKTDDTFSLDSKCAYLRFFMGGGYGATYNHDICINISQSDTSKPLHNGVYEPYSTVTVDTSVLAGSHYVNSSCYDYVENVIEDGQVKGKFHDVADVIIFDGSSDENWAAGGQVCNYYIPFNNLVKASNYTGKILCNRLESVASNLQQTSGNGIMSITGYYDSNNSYPNQNWFYIKVDETITSASALRTWLSNNPITVYFEKATESVTDVEPIPNFPCEDGTTVTAVTPQADLVNMADVPSTIAYMTKIAS